MSLAPLSSAFAATPAYAASYSQTAADTDTPPATRGELPLHLAFKHAGHRRVQLRYEVQGERHLPAVFVAGGISAGRHLASNRADDTAGWWGAQVGVDRALDPTRHCLVSFDWLGADGSFDEVIDPADQADAIAALLDHLGIDTLHSFVGCSYGAMVGLQLAARHRARLAQLVAISGTHRAHPYASAWRALQRQAVALGALQCDEARGVSLARQLAILSYRTPEEFATRFTAARVEHRRVQVAAEDYLAHCGARYVEATPAIAFLRLSESIDLPDLGPGCMDVPVTVIAMADDRLVPVADAYLLAERLRGATRLCVLRSPFGHDAFLKEHEAIARVLRDTLYAEAFA